GGVGDEKMAEKFEKHLRKIEGWIGRQDYMNVLYIKYNDVIKDSLSHAKVVNHFLGERLDVEKMAQVIEKSLYRQRRT
ncbi:MAG: sulfotransferase domain-containing protein, partial [Deltaproteobacteria bacterium]|nr:sulfotransferase domain-containing protein [Deltaproteobacteria bacterium]